MSKKMKPEDVRRRVDALQRMKHDPEAAHSEEDAIWADVLQAIAAGAPNARQLAAEALNTITIDFPRWCA